MMPLRNERLHVRFSGRAGVHRSGHFKPFSATTVLLLICIGGCDTFSSRIEIKPKDWQALEGHTVTVRGTAGNSELGPIVRLSDGGYIALNSRVPWGIDVIARPIDVKGKIISGAGLRAERFVLDAESITLVPPPVKTQ